MVCPRRPACLQQVKQVKTKNLESRILFGDGPSISFLNLQSSLRQASVNSQWEEFNYTFLSTLVMLSPSVATLITTTQKRLTLTLKCPPISTGNQTVNETDGHKVLGVTTDCSLSWSNYVTALCNSICNKIDRLSKFKHLLNLHARKLFFHAHIQSIIGYGSIVWLSKCQYLPIRG